jgi:poly(A) polymerase
MTNSDRSGNAVVVQREQHPISRKQISPGTLDVLYRLSDARFTAYIAGGGVRDLLVGRNPKDFDIATDARPEQIKRLFNYCRLVGRRFRLAHVHMRDEVIEVSTFRANLEDAQQKSRFHAKSDDGMILRDNIYGTPEQDAWRRDFTVNALFYNINDFTIIDYVGGLRDIEAKLIRCIGDPDIRMIEDPVRMIRAARFASTLGFQIEANTEASIRKNAASIALASPARMFEEIQKLFYCGHARDVFHQLRHLGLLAHMLPEVDANVNESPRGLQWIERVARQLDTWRSHRVPVTPELLFALLFGLIHEQKIAELSATGMPIFQAADEAVTAHLVALAPKVLIPKVIGRHLAQIMATQSYFTQIKPNRTKRFMHRPCFHDAFIYFKMRARFDDQHADEVKFWDDQIRTPS